MDTRFTTARGQLEAIFAVRSPLESGAAQSSAEIPQLTRRMTEQLKSMIHELPPGDYVQATLFLRQLEYKSRFTPTPVSLVASR